MKYKHFIIIRFSINSVSTNMHQWKHGIDKWDYNRLNNRFFLFENLTLPSLINQKNKKYLHIIIMISPDLPAPYLSYLKKLIINHKNIHIEIVTSFVFKHIDFLRKYCDEDTIKIATTRIDDDDGLHSVFSDHIATYLEVLTDDDTLITYPRGKWLNLNRNAKTLTYLEFNKKHMSCGLTRIANIDKNDTVYAAGHTRIANIISNVIVNNNNHMYFMTNHHYNDEQHRMRNISKHSGIKKIDEVVLSNFPFVDEKKLIYGQMLNINNNK